MAYGSQIIRAIYTLAETCQITETFVICSQKAGTGRLHPDIPVHQSTGSQ